MYLTRLKLEPTSRTTRTLYLNHYLLHQAIFRAFPDKNDGGAGRVLYRLDVNKNGEVTLYVQSEKVPNWGRAQILKECLSGSDDGSVATRLFRPVFKTGQKLRFRLRANPIAKRKTPDKLGVTRRLGLVREEEQGKWLARKAEGSGFQVLSYTAIPEGKIMEQRNENSDKLTHFAVRFDGVLNVVDPVLFQQTVSCGIGPAKGFGFGLLSLAVIKD